MTYNCNIPDPNIPETGMQKKKSSHGDEECCYTYCGTPGRPCINGCSNGKVNETWPPVQCSSSQPATPRSTAECRPPSYHSSAPARSIPPAWQAVIFIRILPLLAAARTFINLCSVCSVNCARTLRACVKWKSRIVT